MRSDVGGEVGTVFLCACHSSPACPAREDRCGQKVSPVPGLHHTSTFSSSRRTVGEQFYHQKSVFCKELCPPLLTAMGQLWSTSSDTEKCALGSINEKYLKNFKMESKILSEQTQALIEFHLKRGDAQKAASAISDALKDIENAPLSIAVTGESGAGKSSLINALRGMDHEEEGAAPTGPTETTKFRTEYKHPTLRNVSIWDLPGVGTTNFPLNTYLREVKFAEYDFFLIVSATRFKDNDAKLAKAIAQINKKFYFVRTKIDNELNSEQKTKPKTFKKENVLKNMKDECLTQLQVAKVTAAQVFLVSSLDRADYDFPEMENTLLRDLPAHKRHIFMMSLPSVTEAAVDQKRDSLKQKIWWEAVWAAASATIPLVGLFSDGDIEKLQDTLALYRSSFGLDDASLEKIAKDLHVSVERLKANLQSPHLMLAENNESFGEKMKQYMEKALSLVGGPLATGVTFTKTFYLQNYFLEIVASDAKALLKGDLFSASVGSEEGCGK
ncbi:T-cell-specific guanine nucleotide triphosphate-binding protein 2 [Fukomys damarensis]|uniref:Interferon-inducible GTPase 1 n=1 Tax=Fukomys damarensis TaxID=885580 RepID=A0A091D6E9_FUKDA|nr:T-cell-specific guanine nucleotide triphosphate-binding protein 2 [Fukomys damarensis]KFO26637.1 Interferon-inducible GTPase 1 [Fukomys damarensis]